MSEKPYNEPFRTEKIVIKMTLDKARAEKHKDALGVLPIVAPKMNEGDELKASYTFNCNYLGNVAGCLRAVLDIVRDKGVVSQVEINELKHGESLILEIGAALKDLQRELAQ